MSGPRRRGVVACVALCALLVAAGPAPAEAAPFRACGSISNPYAGSRYEGTDIRRVRALNVSCRTARRVARRAHAKALGIPPPASGIRSFRWRRWRVTGNLRGDVDRYAARRSGRRRVRWIF